MSIYREGTGSQTLNFSIFGFFNSFVPMTRGPHLSDHFGFPLRQTETTVRPPFRKTVFVFRRLDPIDYSFVLSLGPTCQ